MSKLPFLQFYPSDYFVDTRVLSLAARGAWVDIICVLHKSSTRGTLTLPARGWARIMGATEADFQSALSEIEEMKVGDVIRNGNGDVSVTCRRMMNESITREQTRLRVQNHRKKHGNKAGNESGNADVTPNKSEVISHKSEEEGSGVVTPPPAILFDDLLDEPERFQDFVVAHELLHLRIPNHGRLFKALMTAHVPGWRSLEVARSKRAAR